MYFVIGLIGILGAGVSYFADRNAGVDMSGVGMLIAVLSIIILEKSIARKMR